MRGDFSRLNFRADKRYMRGHVQQGRVHLDADWIEQVDIQALAARNDVLSARIAQLEKTVAPPLART